MNKCIIIPYWKSLSKKTLSTIGFWHTRSFSNKHTLICFKPLKLCRIIINSFYLSPRNIWVIIQSIVIALKMINKQKSFRFWFKTFVLFSVDERFNNFYSSGYKFLYGKMNLTLSVRSLCTFSQKPTVRVVPAAIFWTM